MSNENNEQGQLLKKVIKISEIRPRDQVGQQKIFSTMEEFAPGFSDWASVMNEKLQTTQSDNERLREDLNKNTQQSKRLVNSLETIIPKFLDQSVNHAKPDLVIAPLKEGEAADVVIADSMKVASEAIYTLSTGEIAEKIGNDQMTASRMSIILRDLGLFGDPKFHNRLSTSKNGYCQKYKPTIIQEIYKRLSSPLDYSLDPEKVSKAANFIRPKGSII